MPRRQHVYENILPNNYRQIYIDCFSTTLMTTFYFHRISNIPAVVGRWGHYTILFLSKQEEGETLWVENYTGWLLLDIQPTSNPGYLPHREQRSSSLRWRPAEFLVMAQVRKRMTMRIRSAGQCIKGKDTHHVTVRTYLALGYSMRHVFYRT